RRGEHRAHVRDRRSFWRRPDARWRGVPLLVKCFSNSPLREVRGGRAILRDARRGRSTACCSLPKWLHGRPNIALLGTAEMTIVAPACRTANSLPHSEGTTMKLPLRQWLRLAAVPAILSLASMLALTLSGRSASSQTRTIKIVVAQPPGGAADTLARLLAEQISRTQGLSMVIENRPGAASIIGTEAASRAASDGNTLLLISPSFVVNSHLRKLNYDP